MNDIIDEMRMDVIKLKLAVTNLNVGAQLKYEDVMLLEGYVNRIKTHCENLSEAEKVVSLCPA
jgi:hypothetical protein